jgi:hypothetical protein
LQATAPAEAGATATVTSVVPPCGLETSVPLAAESTSTTTASLARVAPPVPGQPAFEPVCPLTA